MSNHLKRVRNFVSRVRGSLNAGGKTQVLVLGDSHAEVFTQAGERFPNHYFIVVSVGGATISGLSNPNSKTQALKMFEDGLDRHGGDICLTLLGEVDTGFVIWYRAERGGTTVEEAFQKAVENYRNLLSRISYKRSVICISAPLPTIRDDQDWGDVANERKEVRATQLERTRLTVRFNSVMEQICREEGYGNINLDSQSLSPDGLVRETLMNADPNDHHYDNKAYLDLVTTANFEALVRR
ncbi:SGNH/GDSL hydrolase family protein [Haloferula sp.]|uniref:SGNH/GDSL hydrolase family protein n=1 Tax=Haloferula sp. TaxID=2497595 RepID=UPI003C716B6D